MVAQRLPATAPALRARLASAGPQVANPAVLRPSPDLPRQQRHSGALSRAGAAIAACLAAGAAATPGRPRGRRQHCRTLCLARTGTKDDLAANEAAKATKLEALRTWLGQILVVGTYDRERQDAGAMMTLDELRVQLQEVFEMDIGEDFMRTLAEVFGHTGENLALSFEELSSERFLVALFAAVAAVQASRKRVNEGILEVPPGGTSSVAGKLPASFLRAEAQAKQRQAEKVHAEVALLEWVAEEARRAKLASQLVAGEEALGPQPGATVSLDVLQVRLKEVVGLDVGQSKMQRLAKACGHTGDFKNITLSFEELSSERFAAELDKIKREQEDFKRMAKEMAKFLLPFYLTFLCAPYIFVLLVTFSLGSAVLQHFPDLSPFAESVIHVAPITDQWNWTVFYSIAEGAKIKVFPEELRFNMYQAVKLVLYLYSVALAHILIPCGATQGLVVVTSMFVAASCAYCVGCVFLSRGEEKPSLPFL